MLTIGLTGGIGSGKSNVARILGKLGAKVLDADKVGHSVYHPTQGEAYHDVVRAFGKDIVAPDGFIDRKRLGAKVFGDPLQLKRLTDIVWPAIEHRLENQLKLLKEQGEYPIAVVEAAVMLEAGWNKLVDSVWVTVVPVEVAKQRIMSRDKLPEAEAIRRITSQMSNEERLKYADVVIDTNGPFEQTEQRVIDAWNAFRKKYGLDISSKSAL